MYMGCAGLVCTGCGSDLVGWDPRATKPMVFAEEDFSPVQEMVALEASERHGAAQLLTGGLKQTCTSVEAFDS